MSGYRFAFLSVLAIVDLGVAVPVFGGQHLEGPPTSVRVGQPLPASARPSAAQEAWVQRHLNAGQRAQLRAVARDVAMRPGGRGFVGSWSLLIEDLAKGGLPVDVNALVQWVLREAYLETSQELRLRAEKVEFFNKQKRALRDEVNRARQHQAQLRDSPERAGPEPLEPKPPLEKLDSRRAVRPASPKPTPPQAKLRARPASPKPMTPQAKLRAGAGTTALEPARASLDAQELERELAAVGEDAQLASVDLQNILQKQQQLLQMLSNISKQLHDRAMSIIRKFGG